jgi:hypothetical protein
LIMLLFTTTALSAVVIGWPCQRLNWAWRNVWSTCSINAYVPWDTTGHVTTAQVPNHFLFTSSAPNLVGASTTDHMIVPSGVFTPKSSAGAGPASLCTTAPATGTGFTAHLRNRCRRAIDAYGTLVKQCVTLNPAVAANTLTPREGHAPAALHVPHVDNVKGLTLNAFYCLKPTGYYATPQTMTNTPANTCPGLLGWFTVVFNACGFTNAPGLHPNQHPNGINSIGPYTAHYVTPNGLTPNVLTGAAPATPAVGWFCTTGIPTAVNTGVPGSWNNKGTIFKTSRCRKALDQFGRTASRCHMSGTPAGNVGGYEDPLRSLAVGQVAAGQPTGPSGLNVIAPNCNTQ